MTTDHFTSPTTVANFRDVREHWNPQTQQWDDPRYVYIGRFNVRYKLPTSKWRNPYRLTKDTPDHRAEVIHEYAKLTLGKMRLGELDIAELRGKVLVCWCAPQACHGDWLAHMANAAPGEGSE